MGVVRRMRASPAIGTLWCGIRIGGSEMDDNHGEDHGEKIPLRLAHKGQGQNRSTGSSHRQFFQGLHICCGLRIARFAGPDMGRGPDGSTRQSVLPTEGLAILSRRGVVLRRDKQQGNVSVGTLRRHTWDDAF